MIKIYFEACDEEYKPDANRDSQAILPTINSPEQQVAEPCAAQQAGPPLNRLEMAKDEFSHRFLAMHYLAPSCQSINAPACWVDYTTKPADSPVVDVGTETGFGGSWVSFRSLRRAETGPARICHHMAASGGGAAWEPVVPLK